MKYKVRKYVIAFLVSCNTKKAAVWLVVISISHHPTHDKRNAEGLDTVMQQSIIGLANIQLKPLQIP